MSEAARSIAVESPRVGGPDLVGALSRHGFFILVAVVLVVFALLRPSFVTPGNIHGMLMSASIAALMFLGLTWLVAAGEIDVSFMSVAALSNMVAASLVANGNGWEMAAVGGLAVGLAFGALNAFLVAVLRDRPPQSGPVGKLVQGWSLHQR